ncbi:MAG: hypothetical protein CL814_14490 [Confluentimicrobium sp.]|uniref:hypothetical protein n=1 Tax=Actibacterium sp. TaxID=1872125 RepID=UPI000C6BAD32|nr:hypothetical protein [Actibacterium sp.]MBC58124.1 hypothetical protein [Actibacterium sp.]|tara:strand:+ start:552 stop:980 length:429 start_codon:yes stop_codon:yes gene_type:complete
MKKSLAQKPARKAHSSQFEMTPAMQDRMQKAMVSIGKIADKQARKDDKVQREARLAIAETFDAWLDWMGESAPEQIEEIFFELGCFATAANRRRMSKHAKAPEGVAERAQEQVDRWKAEEEAAKAAATEEAQDKSDATESHA